jgi:peptide/nickel transport system permease protein
MPDGQEISLGTYGTRSTLTYYPQQDQRLRRKLAGRSPMQALFGGLDEDSKLLQGRHELRVNGLIFGEVADLDAELVMYGLTCGLMGTDGAGRDLIIPLLRGAPIALAFGLLAAIGASSFATWCHASARY